MRYLFSVLFVILSAIIFSGCNSNGSINVPELGEQSADFKVFMQKKNAGLRTLKDPRLGLIPSPLDNTHLLKQFIMSPAKTNSIRNATDSAYDLRNYNRVTPVKDQGGCGACWSFSAISSLESVFMPGEVNDFSENNLKNLHGFDWGPCYGGNSDMAAAYFMRWSGPGNEVDDPYGESDDISPALSPVKHVSDYYSVSSASIISIKEAVVEFGAVDADMYWNDANFNDTTDSYYYSGSSDINHGISIVGWDDSYSKSNFNSAPSSDGAWIIKNSWGSSWGDGGYFYISYEDSKINSNCHVFKATDVEYENLYSYDPFGRIGWGGYGSETAWISNVFTAAGDETLKAVSFYANAHSTSYEVRIYTGATSNPTTGATLQATQSGTLVRSGYNSIILNSPVDLSSGVKFSIVIKVTTPGNTNPVPLEMPYSGYANSTASSGQSFMAPNSSGNPGTWLDIHNDGYSADTNINIKAYTVNQEDPEEPDTVDTDLDTDTEEPDGDTDVVSDLVINEIDYNQPSTDTAEFIEIYNKGDSSVNLSGMSLVLRNGADNTTYATINLPDVDLAAGDYYVVCGDASNVANCDLDTSPDTDLIQNGDPDAVALFSGTDLLDTVSYGGDTAGIYTETSGAGTDDSAMISVGLSRYPDGADTDNNSSDFSLRCTTPGEVNSADTENCACGNGTVDIGEDCEPVEGSCCSDTCEFKTSDVLCRDTDGYCDKAEYCTGTSAACPVDEIQPDTFECRSSAGVCDAAEVCDGVSNNCPEDIKLTTVCRGQSAYCDEAEFCDGVSNDCPEDKVKPDTLKCRSSAGVCDSAEYCDGTNKTCPADLKLTTECRVSTGICDVAEFCDGINNDCPEDEVATVNAECRSSAGDCDAAEFCNGINKTCPADVKKTSECRASTGDCDVAEVCDGVNNDCPDDKVKSHTVQCRSSAGVCDLTEFCDGTTKICPEDVKLTTQCRASAGACDVADFCDGIGNDCPEDLKLTTECRAKDGICDVAEVCDGISNDCPVDGFVTMGIQCRESTGECDVAETCSGADGICPIDEFVADGDTCVGDGYPWTTYQCSSGVCESGEELYGSCITPNEISVFPYSDTQDTTGRPDHVISYGTGCDAIKGNGADVVYELHVKAGYSYTVTLNSTEDFAVALLNACGDDEACFEAADAQTTGAESVEFTATENVIYALIVETADSAGEYTLTVTETEVEIPDEVEDTDITDNEAQDTDEEVTGMVDNDVEDNADEEVEDIIDEEWTDTTEVTDQYDESEIPDEAEDTDVTDSEITDSVDEDMNNSDTIPLNDEDDAYNNTN